MKKIVHIDLNTFFVQCELLSRPDLIGKIVAIANDNRRGVISTSSYEARKVGIHSGMALSIAKQKSDNLILIPPHFQLYKKKSDEFFSCLKERFKILEMASIDECYIDMSEEIKDFDEHDFLFDLQIFLYQKTRLKCSIGLGDNRFLAKMGSDYKKPMGLTIIHRKDIESMIWPLKIESFFGIGKKTGPKLKELGINTIGDLAISTDEKVKKLLGSSYTNFKNCCYGISDDFVSNKTYDRKSISSERTFLEDVTSFDEISMMIKQCVLEVTDSLKRQKKMAEVISLKWRNSNFVTKSKRRILSKISDDESFIYQEVMLIFEEVFDDNPIRLVGVCVEKLIDNKKDDSFIDEINSKLREKGKIFKGVNYVDE